MTYIVKEEKGYNGTKPRYSVNQKLSDTNITDIKNRFRGKPYDYKDTRISYEMRYYDYDIFMQKFPIYYIYLEKVIRKI